MTESNDNSRDGKPISDEQRVCELENALSMIETLEDMLGYARKNGMTLMLISRLKDLFPCWQVSVDDPTIEDFELLVDQMRRYAKKLTRHPYKTDLTMAEPTPWPALEPTSQGGDINIRPIIKRLDKILIRNKEPEK